MPQAIALIPTLVSAVVSFASTTFGSFVISAGIAAIAAGVNYLISNKPAVPNPSDGKYNLKQNVPDLVRIYGRVRKGGDYLLLEERDGVAHHIICHAAHKVHAYVEHWLHDERVYVDGTGRIVNPSRFGNFAAIGTRLGLNAETAHAATVLRFPEIWTWDHRGDGIATAELLFGTVAAEEYQKVYPQQMPLYTAVIDGAELLDPRSNTVAFTTNLALIRMDHLMHPSGGAKLSIDDLYLPDWQHAADVCDQLVANRQSGSEPRYHGSLWYRYSNDQVQIGRLIDQAAELVIYERADGKVGVHAGEFVEPDIRLTETDLMRVSFGANRSKAQTVLAVRGRYTSAAERYNMVDASTYGDPYLSIEDQRTKTIENQVVHSHNHMTRLEKLAYIRANAPRVTVVASYEAARDVPYRRFIRVHRPPLLVEAVIEILDRPKLSLANLTYEISGIVVPADLYEFDAATEEGEPGAPIVRIASGQVPAPSNFGITMSTRDLGGSQPVAYARATWDHLSDVLTYELEWQPVAGGAAASVTSKPGDDQVESNYLSDGVAYRFRLRTWSVGASSIWTTDIIATATADPVAPGIPVGVSATGGAGSATLDWTTPNSANFAATRVYRSTSNSFGTATLVTSIFSAASTPRAYVNSGLPAGTYYYWLVAANFSGVESAPVATGAVTVS